MKEIQDVSTIFIVLCSHYVLFLIIYYTDIQEKFEEAPILTQRIDATKESISETQSYTQEFMPKKEGVYSICLDNSHNSFLDNIVQVL